MHRAQRVKAQPIGEALEGRRSLLGNLKGWSGISGVATGSLRLKLQASLPRACREPSTIAWRVSLRQLGSWPSKPHRRIRLQRRDVVRVQKRTVPGYTLSASGRSSNRCEVVVAQLLSLIRRPDAPFKCEISGLNVPLGTRLTSSKSSACAAVNLDSLPCDDLGRSGDGSHVPASSGSRNDLRRPCRRCAPRSRRHVLPVMAATGIR
jgi:hypothetical protein